MEKKLKLNQIIAISAGEKTRKHKILTDLYKSLDKRDLFEGFSKKYSPKDEEGERFPDETKQIQVNVQQAITEVINVCKNMFNIIASQDVGNCLAKADIKVDGNTVAAQVPVTHLLFLEKQLVDLNTFVQALPTLDPAETWTYDDKSLVFISNPKETTKTKKVPKVLVKAEATEKHPAQVETYYEDVPIGTWVTVKYSGTISTKEKLEILERIRSLDKAVKLAREEANSIEVETQDFGTKILSYIFK